MNWRESLFCLFNTTDANQDIHFIIRGKNRILTTNSTVEVIVTIDVVGNTIVGSRYLRYIQIKHMP